MKDERCKGCHHILFKVGGELKVPLEIKCPRVKCGTVNKFGREEVKV